MSQANKPYTKYQVQYENPAKDPRYHCSICEHYVNKTTCQIVQGKIDPEAWCNKFEKKK